MGAGSEVSTLRESLGPALAEWARHEHAGVVLEEVSRRCAAFGLPVLVVKGAVTGRILYDDAAERPIVDVDLRVRRADFATFRRLAREARWSCCYVSLSRRNLVYEFTPLELDVECSVGPPGVCALTVETMLSRASALDIGSRVRVLVPEIHDHAVLLSVNAFKDKLFDARTGAVSDLERIVLAPGFRPEVFIDRVVESRVATLAWIVACWMSSSRGSDAWARIAARIERRTRPRRAYVSLFRFLVSAPNRFPLALRAVTRASADRPAMRAEALIAAGLWEIETRLRRWAAAPYAERGRSS